MHKGAERTPVMPSSPSFPSKELKVNHPAMSGVAIATSLQQ
jgi:hypothetical protein